MSRKLGPGLYRFDDLAVGDWFETGGIVVTEAHIVGFAGLSGDFFDIHMDDRAAEARGFPARVAHGLLVLALIDGLKNRAEPRLDAIASLGWDWRFTAPVFAGDRISATATVEALDATRKPDRGVLRLGLVARKDGGEIVQDGATTLMMRRARS